MSNVKRALAIFAVLVLMAGCRSGPKPLIDPELAAYMPADATVLAGIDLDRLRTAAVYSKIPESFRQGSYTVVGLSGKDLVTASREGARVAVSGPAVKGNPPELLRYATGDPIWVVARGNAQLPLTGNLANVNRLLQQTEYTTMTARAAERVELRITGVCRTPQAARHLEENVRAIASLMKLPLEVSRDGATVFVNGSVAF